MKLATKATVLATGLALLMTAVGTAGNDPIFVKWLVVDDPGDETIRHYWEQAEAGELSPEQLVDLGTLLFYRGWPNDAVHYFREALDADPDLSDAWFRIGLVRHHGGDLSSARSAYKKCLKRQSGHAWGNFYLGLLEEQTGDAKAAMRHYETAFKHAPGLADPKINPEILSSKLQLGAQVRHFDRERFENMTPMPLLEPATMRKVRRQFEPTPVTTPTPTPTAIVGPNVTPTPIAAYPAGGAARGGAGKTTTGPAATRRSTTSGGGSNRSTTSTRPSPSNAPQGGTTPYGVPTPPPEQPGSGAAGGTGGTAPRIGDTSPEASLKPLWPALYRLAEAFV